MILIRAPGRTCVDTLRMPSWLRETPTLDPGSWDSPSGRTRVLVENPEPSVLWAYADALRSAGYEVATCAGPGAQRGGPGACPLVATGRCALVEGADVLVSTSDLPDIRSILAAIGPGDSPRVVLETPPPVAEDYREVAPEATLVTSPVTEELLFQAVADSAAA
jgi:hypothetical protein